MKMKTRAIIFDLFGTLVPQFPMDRFESSLREMASYVGLDYQTFFNAWIGQTNIRRQTGSFSSFREEIAWICQQNNVEPSEEGLTKGEGSNGQYTFLVEPLPKLDWTGETGFETDGVNPDQADSGTEFNFSVSYSHPLDLPAVVSQVLIDLNDDG